MSRDQVSKDVYFETNPYGVYCVLRLDKECLQLNMPDGFVGFQMSPARTRTLIVHLEKSWKETMLRIREKIDE